VDSLAFTPDGKGVVVLLEDRQTVVRMEVGG
jgi:hypothetical protein